MLNRELRGGGEDRKLTFNGLEKYMLNRRKITRPTLSWVLSWISGVGGAVLSCAVPNNVLLSTTKQIQLCEGFLYEVHSKQAHTSLSTATSLISQHSTQNTSNTIALRVLVLIVPHGWCLLVQFFSLVTHQTWPTWTDGDRDSSILRRFDSESKNACNKS